MRNYNDREDADMYENECEECGDSIDGGVTNIVDHVGEATIATAYVVGQDKYLTIVIRDGMPVDFASNNALDTAMNMHIAYVHREEERIIHGNNVSVHVH